MSGPAQKAKTVTISMQHQTHAFLLSSIFPVSSGTDIQICFGSVKSGARMFFLIRLNADCCDIVLRRETIEHILGFERRGGKKKSKKEKIH